MKNAFFLFIGLLFIFGSFYLYFNKEVMPRREVVSESDPRDIETEEEANEAAPRVVLAGTSVSVEIARTPPERNRGLSGREELMWGHGMLFIMDEPGLHGFWMKDMKFPIDIIWIDENLVVQDISAELPPESYPKIFYPKTKAKYVLEVPAGFSKSYGIAPGIVLQLLDINL